MDLARLDALNNPGRFDEVARLHANAFRWRPQGRIPLGIHVVDPQHMGGFDYADWLEPGPVFEFQARVLADTLTVGSDLLPAVAINHLGDAVLPSMFGAEFLMPQESGTTLQDVGPTPRPVFSSIEEAAARKAPDLDAGILPDVLRIARYYRERLPDWVHVVAPMPAGAFSAAMELRGSPMMLDLLERPALCRKLLDTCVRLQAAVELHVRSSIGMKWDRHVTNFGIQGTGLRLGEDSIVNLSPAMIRQFCVPAVRTTNSLCGGRGHVHFCSLAHSRFEHVYGAFADQPDVAVVSSQFGFEFYQEHLADLRGRLAIESFYGDGYPYVCRQYGTFKGWADFFVPRFKDESGLVLYCQVESVEEGREVWAAWQQAHAR